MNRNHYRVIFNAARGQRMVVQENARSCGKACGGQTVAAGAGAGGQSEPASSPQGWTKLARHFAMAMLATHGSLALAQIVADPSAPGAQRPTVLNAANGVPQVNIQTPSAAGVSRNTYSQFDVQREGAILNNSRTNTQTQLGGWVQGNPWLATGSARIILNEVNSNNPSQLRGYVEVAGPRAEVIIANPAGVAIDGAGFINASRATITTGTPVLNGGSLEGYRVQRGSVSIDGQGLDASTSDYTGILARAVQVNAGVWANNLQVVTGVNDVGTAEAGDNAAVRAGVDAGAQQAPRYALDVAHLGGMYAGKITLVGTEAGVGVRNAGHIGASAGEVIVTANGQLVNSGQIFGTTRTNVALQGSLDNTDGQIAANEGVDIAALNLTNRAGAIQTAEIGDVAIHVEQAISNTQGGQIAAGGNTNITALELDNTAGRIAAVKSTSIDIQGDASNTQGLIASNEALTVAAQSLNNDEGSLASVNGTVRVQAEGGLHNASGRIQAAQDIGLDTKGAIINAQGVIHAGKSLRIETGGADLDNSNTKANGGIFSQGDANIRVANLNNQGGALASQGALNIDAAKIDNSAGGLGSGAALTVQASALGNRQGSVQAGGDASVLAAQTVDNTAGSIRSNGKLAIDAAKVTNQGTLATSRGIEASEVQIRADNLDNVAGAVVANDNVAAAVAQNLDNTGGVIAARAAVQIDGRLNPAGDATTLNIRNSAGQVSSAERISIHANSLDGADGKLLSQGDLIIDLQQGFSQTEQGQTQANGTLQLSAQDVLNAGQLLAGERLQVTANTIENTQSGQIAASQTTQLTAHQSLQNRGLIDGGTTQLNAQELDNVGTGRIYGNKIEIAARNIRNREEHTPAGQRQSATIAARESLSIGTDTLSNEEGALILSAGGMAIGGALDAQGNVTGSAGLVRNASATIESVADMQIAANEIRNSNEHLQTEVAEVGRTGMRKIHIIGDKEYADEDVLFVGQETFMGSAPFTVGGAWLDNVSDVRWFAQQSLVLPSEEYPFDKFGPANGLNGIPARAYQPGRDSESPVNEKYTYGVDSPLWDLFGVEKPDSDPPEYQRPCVAGHGETCPPNPYQAWKKRNHAAYMQLDAEIRKFAADIRSRSYREWTFRNVEDIERQTVVVSSDPGRITAGGNARFSGRLINDKSQIMAGGTLQADGLTNIAADGVREVQSVGESVWTWIKTHTAKRDDRRNTSTPYDQTVTYTIKLPIAKVQQGQAVQFSGQSASNPLDIQSVAASTTTAAGADSVYRTMSVNVSLPTASLYTQNPASTARYLVETDPRFANQQQWLSSDFLLEQLQYDPALVQKRLGDGYYEQQLIREQIGQLTGHRYLDGYSSDEAQFQALMRAGATYAKAHQLVPGIALTAEQMAQLTSDIVWLVEREVTASDGSIQRVLVPQVYVKVREGDVSPTGTLLAASQIHLNLSDDLHNSGTIAGRDIVKIDADSIVNLGGSIRGRDVALKARTDLQNIGGSIAAGSALIATAGRDMRVASTTTTTKGASGSTTAVDRVAALYVGEEAGQGVLIASAGQDLTLTAARIRNDSAADTAGTLLNAGRDVRLETVKISQDNLAQWDRNNWRTDSSSQDIGSDIQTAKNLQLEAGQDITIKASSLSSTSGNLSVTAGQDIRLEAGQSSQAFEEAHKVKSGGLLSKKVTTTYEALSTTRATGSTLSAEAIELQAGRDLGITASDVVGTHEVNLRAGNDIAIAAGQHSQSQERFREVKKSGLFSGGGLGFTIGKQKQSTDTATSSNTAAPSMVGSVSGDTQIQAGRRYQQTGSTVSSPQGDVNIRAQQVDIEAAQDGHSHDYQYKFEQKGLTVAVNAPVVNAMQAAASAVKSVEKIGKSKDDRINALAAANTAWETYQSAGTMRQIAQDPKAAASQDISVSITYGEQKSHSESHSRSTEAAASQIYAGGKVNITAKGAGENSTINIIGSDVAGQGGTHLQADNAVNILAAEQTSTERSSNTSSGWNAGAAISYGQSGMAFGITAGGNHGKGTGNGDDTSYRNSHVGSRDSATTIQSAGATNIIGGQVTGQSVGMEAAELNIQSLQDTSVYNSKQKDMSAQVTVGYGASASGSYSQSKINADYAAVREQSAILAGDDGYQIRVDGNTDLQGGLITSSQLAEATGKNSLTTGTLTASDIQNRANYDGESFGVTASGAINGGWDGKTVDKKGNATNALSKSVGLGSDSESAASTTRSGINTSNITITDQAKQQALTGQTADEVVAAIHTDATTDNYASQAGYLDNNFDSERVQDELDLQREVTQDFSANVQQAKAQINSKLDALKEQLDEGSITQEEYDKQRSQLQNLSLGLSTVAAGLLSPTDNAAGTVAATVSPAIAYEIGQHFKGTGQEGSAQHVLAHAVLAAAVASAGGNDAASAALAAAGAEAVMPVISRWLYGKEGKELTAQEKETVSAIAGLAGTAIGATSDTASAVASGQAGENAVDNNQFNFFDPTALAQYGGKMLVEAQKAEDQKKGNAKTYEDSIWYCDGVASIMCQYRDDALIAAGSAAEAIALAPHYAINILIPIDDSINLVMHYGAGAKMSDAEILQAVGSVATTAVAGGTLKYIYAGANVAKGVYISSAVGGAANAVVQAVFNDGHIKGSDVLMASAISGVTYGRGVPLFITVNGASGATSSYFAGQSALEGAVTSIVFSGASMGLGAAFSKGLSNSGVSTDLVEILGLPFESLTSEFMTQIYQNEKNENK